MENRTTYNPIVSDEMLSNYFIGQASFEEAILIDEWMRKDAVNKFLYEQYVKVFLLRVKATDESAVPKIHSGWQSVIRQISSSDQVIEPSFRGGVFKPALKRIGIAVLVVMFFSFLHWRNSIKQLSSDSGEKEMVLKSGSAPQRFVLPDGSIAILNNDSRLELQEHSYESSRREIILDGEAYFSAIPDYQKAFVVKFKDAKVRALGSIFNIRASPVFDSIVVTVQSGSLVFSDSDSSIVVESGETGIYSKSKRKFYKAHGVDNNAIAYATKRLVFTETPLKEVFNSLKSTYGIGFTIMDPAIESVKFSAVFEAAPLDFILMVISKGAMIKFSSVDKSILVDSIPSS